MEYFLLIEKSFKIPDDRESGYPMPGDKIDGFFNRSVIDEEFLRKCPVQDRFRFLIVQLKELEDLPIG